MITSGTGTPPVPPIRPEPIQLKPGINSGWVSPPVRTSEAPVMIDIVPRVTMNGFSLSPLVIAPLAAPISPPAISASTLAIQMPTPAE